jgi:hypothetical protein
MGKQGYDFMIVYGGYPLFTCFMLQRFIVCSLYFRVRCDHTLYFDCHCILSVPLFMIKALLQPILYVSYTRISYTTETTIETYHNERLS